MRWMRYVGRDWGREIRESDYAEERRIESSEPKEKTESPLVENNKGQEKRKASTLNLFKACSLVREIED